MRPSGNFAQTATLRVKPKEVLSDAAIDYVLERMEEEINKRFAALGGEMDAMRRRKAVLESELNRLTRVIADGMDSPAIRAAISEREAELATIATKTLGRKRGSVRQQIVGLRKFVRESLADVRALLAGKHSNPTLVRQELARHIDAITLTTEGKIGISYKGRGKVLGDTECAEGRNSTERLTFKFRFPVPLLVGTPPIQDRSLRRAHHDPHRD
jgi:hypothetical protein